MVAAHRAGFCAGVGTIAADVPQEWYSEPEDMERLVEELLRRREMVPQLIEDFRASSRNAFSRVAL
ncbi:MAG: hypothetical protein ACM3JB_18740 [Acidobacteriaceae bacterium]